MPIYMQYEGIKGAVTEAGHKDWVELESFQVGVSRHITTQPGKGADRSPSVANVSEVMVTKTADKSFVNTFKAAVGGGAGKKCVIDFCRNENNKIEKYLTVTLENALISSHNISAHGGDAHSAPMESLSINYTKIEFAWVSRDSKDASGGADRANYNLSEGKAG